MPQVVIKRSRRRRVIGIVLMSLSLVSLTLAVMGVVDAARSRAKATSFEARASPSGGDDYRRYARETDTLALLFGGLSLVLFASGFFVARGRRVADEAPSSSEGHPPAPAGGHERVAVAGGSDGN